MASSICFILYQITWVEHNEIKVEEYLCGLFGEQVSSGFAFCAGRWMTMLKHQTENQYQIKQHLNGIKMEN